ncbi:hypothetical protein P1J78_22625 [Psychromarinibacter sp. C21-152]|uniref:Uncharacterized protein n=1 Tax=Psychromarinibacter sediminicola TaxID=3033385 RepID=A0AAE3NWJ5_9RHOB|nr:hypothetical protein [Psychromarinibacter sediminicola]MDF0603529.1 hypothetical protein [Psychromarinibacter sediminicola]
MTSGSSLTLSSTGGNAPEADISARAGASEYVSWAWRPPAEATPIITAIASPVFASDNRPSGGLACLRMQFPLLLTMRWPQSGQARWFLFGKQNFRKMQINHKH